MRQRERIGKATLRDDIRRWCGVIARGTVVRLAGLMPEKAERDMTERDAWYVLGVGELESLIEVKSVPEPAG